MTDEDTDVNAFEILLSYQAVVRQSILTDQLTLKLIT